MILLHAPEISQIFGEIIGLYLFLIGKLNFFKI